MKSEVTRGRILRSARDLYLEKGFGATSLRDVAAGAGLTHTAVRRYFTSPPEVLAAVWDRLEVDAADDRIIATVLLGDAASVTHPAHRRMASLIRRERAGDGAATPDADAIRAVRDGLRIAARYDLTIDPVRQHAAFLAWWRAEPSPPLTGSPGVPTAPRPAPATGRGDVTAHRVLSAAAGVFAADGYHRARLDAIAARADVSKASVIHHFASKKALAVAVLDRIAPSSDGDGWRCVAVMGGEALPPAHPLHDEVAARSRARRGALAEQLRSAGGIDAEDGALRLLALSHGLMIHRCYGLGKRRALAAQERVLRRLRGDAH